MKVIKADIVRNETGEVMESSEFTGADAQEQADAWATGRRQAAESANMVYGPDMERDIVVTDISGERTKKLEIEDRAEAREFGLGVIDAIAAYNKKFKTPEEMLTMFSNPTMSGIMLALLTGGIATARGLVAAVGPTYYPADFVAAIVAKMDEQIASENESEA